jgi:hypothetical protein
MPERSKSRYCLLTLGFLKDSPGRDTRTLRDMAVAFLKMCPFFPNHQSASIKEFLESEVGAPFKDSQLFRTEERAEKLPKTRSHASSNNRPHQFWSEWDRRLKSLGRQKGSEPEIITITDYPKQWKVSLRPILARRKSNPWASIILSYTRPLTVFRSICCGYRHTIIRG